MSVAGIASNLLSYVNSSQSRASQVQAEFQQLAQDLQAGNLTQAQSDFAALSQNSPAGTVGANTSVSQAFNALGQDLKAGNLSAAQQQFSNIQQDFQQASQAVHHHHHHGGGGGENAAPNATQNNSVAQLFDTLGQDLQAGNLTSAQQAFASLQQDLQIFSAGSSSGVGSYAPNSISLTA